MAGPLPSSSNVVSTLSVLGFRTVMVSSLLPTGKKNSFSSKYPSQPLSPVKKSGALSYTKPCIHANLVVTPATGVLLHHLTALKTTIIKLS